MEAVEPTFEWDPRKNAANLDKHGIGFSEATTVFADPLARIIADEDHSAIEEREIIIGHSWAKRLLFVCFTERAGGRIRIVSARRANRREQHDYEDRITP